MSALSLSEMTGTRDILIVDDSSEDIALIRRQLRGTSYGAYTTREALSAHQALEECLLHPPACLLLDMRMPELDGLAFLDRVSQAGPIPFPIIMLTSYGEEGVAAKALQRGAQDFLIKGQTTPQLLDRAIEHARERFRIGQELAASRAQLARVNAELSQNVDRLQAIFAQSSVGIAQTDLAGRFTLANDAFCRLSGRDHAQLLACSHQELVDRSGEHPGEVQYLRPDESTVWVHQTVSILRDQQGQPVGQVILAKDVTARKVAQDAQCLLASIVEASADAVIYQDLQGVIRTWNRGAESTYGYSSLEAVGLPFEMLVPADKVAECRNMRREAELNRPLQGLETTRIRKDGYRVPVAETFSAVWNNAGELIGFSSFDRDVSDRRRAERALQKSEQRYRLLANAMPQIVYTNNAAGEREFVNEKWSEYTGCTAADALVFGWVTRLHPEDQQAAVAKWTEAVGAGSAFESEFRLRRADGEYCWHLSRATPVTNAQGAVTGWIGTATNIHDRKLAESKLRLSEERLRLAQNAGGIVIWDLDLKLDRYTESPEFFEQFEFEPGAVVGFQDWLERVHPEDRDRIGLATQDPLRYGRGVELEFRVLRGDGTVRWLLGKGSTICDSEGQPVRVTGVNVDITLRKQAEVEVRESRERLRLALSAARMGIWKWDVPRDRVTCSDEIALAFGHTGMPSLSLESFFQQVHPTDAREVISQVRAALEHGAPYSSEFRLLRPNGEISWMELQGAVARGSSGEDLRMIGTARDITGRKAMEQKLAAAAKFESIGVMASGLAHDFNNLLVSVIGCASLAQDQLPPGHPVGDLMEDVLKAGERAALLTSQMLAYSGKGQFVHEPVEISQSVREAAVAIQPKMRPGAELLLDLEPGALVTGDGNQIRQVIVNLLANAAESLDLRDGKIWVRTRTLAIDRNYIDRVLRSADIGPGVFIGIEVRDTGCGIPDQIRDKIFEPFFSTKFAGRGLGLAAVAGIVKTHQGAVQITGSSAAGTTVMVLLPAAPSRKPERAQDPVKTAPEAESHTVLVVDDEDVVASVAAAFLRRSGYRVLIANSGIAALDLIRITPEISVVLLDLTMPHMNGREVLRRIREMSSELPVILSSGYSQENALSQIEGQEIAGFLQKPYTGAALLNKVSQSLNLAQAG